MAASTLLYRPSFFDEAKASLHYAPDIASAYREGVLFRKRNKVPTASEQFAMGYRNALCIVDPEKDFRDDGRLPVLGANAAILNMVIMLINGTVENQIDLVVESKDVHGIDHIGADINWVTREGEPLDLRIRKAALLELMDPDQALFRAYGPEPGNPELGEYYPANPMRRGKAVEYAQHMRDTGQGDIWVFNVHCVEGSDGVETHPLLVEGEAFYAGVTLSSVLTVRKGFFSDRDWFGALQPCMPIEGMPNGGFNTDLANMLLARRKVYVGGVATDFCVDAFIAQLMKHFGRMNSNKIRPVIDGAAAIVPEAAHVLARREELIRLGGQLVCHNDFFA